MSTTYININKRETCHLFCLLHHVSLPNKSHCIYIYISPPSFNFSSLFSHFSLKITIFLYFTFLCNRSKKLNINKFRQFPVPRSSCPLLRLLGFRFCCAGGFSIRCFILIRRLYIYFKALLCIVTSLFISPCKIRYFAVYLLTD